jgi:8-oxo-dGTP pyrophosphatase MutT (NUDIX family)
MIKEKVIPARARSDNSPKVTQTSAGGVAFRIDDGGLRIAIIQMLPELRWQLPKGIIDPGETPEIAALREVREEAGIECELLEPIERIEYWFSADRAGVWTRIHKYVHFFLLRYIDGDVADHDHEVAEARWVTVEEASTMLAFEAERAVVRQAIEMVSSRQG